MRFFNFAIKYDKKKKRFYYIEKDGDKRIIPKTMMNLIVKTISNKKLGKVSNKKPYIKLEKRNKLILHGVDVDDKRLREMIKIRSRLLKKKKKVVKKTVEGKTDEKKSGVYPASVKSYDNVLTKKVENLYLENQLHQSLQPYKDKKTDDRDEYMKKQIEEMKMVLKGEDKKPVNVFVNYQHEEKKAKPIEIKEIESDEPKIIEERETQTEDVKYNVDDLKFVENVEEKYLQCPICEQILSFGKYRTKKLVFSNMARHVNTKHKDVINNDITAEQVESQTR